MTSCFWRSVNLNHSEGTFWHSWYHSGCFCRMFAIGKKKSSQSQRSGLHDAPVLHDFWRRPRDRIEPLLGPCDWKLLDDVCYTYHTLVSIMSYPELHDVYVIDVKLKSHVYTGLRIHKCSTQRSVKRFNNLVQRDSPGWKWITGQQSLNLKHNHMLSLFCWSMFE